MLASTRVCPSIHADAMDLIFALLRAACTVRSVSVSITSKDICRKKDGEAFYMYFKALRRKPYHGTVAHKHVWLNHCFIAAVAGCLLSGCLLSGCMLSPWLDACCPIQTAKIESASTVCACNQYWAHHIRVGIMLAQQHQTRTICPMRGSVHVWRIAVWRQSREIEAPGCCLRRI